MVEVLSARAGTRPDVQYLSKRGEDIEHSSGDPTAARSVLGFSAQVSLEDGLRVGQ
jgi:nucleoside-diphosphate-sugar epimerase